MFAAPDADACKAFKQHLTSRRYFVKIRETRGAEKMARA
jgi:hypothetical protein